MTQEVERFSPSKGPKSPRVWGVYEPNSGSIQYVCAAPDGPDCAIIDAVQHYDIRAGSTSLAPADTVLALTEREGLKVRLVIETHPHADHFAAGAAVAERTGALLVTGEKVREVAALWDGFYGQPATDCTQYFDRLLADGDTVDAGALTFDVLFTPGHTLASLSFVCGDAAFVADTFMVPDSGTSRADFPGGSGDALWNSLQRILALPDETRVFVGHDYCRGGREPIWESTVAEQRVSNIHLAGGVDRDGYIAVRAERDATLKLPDRMLAALQVNIRGGRLPEPDREGRRFLRIPLDLF